MKKIPLDRILGKLMQRNTPLQHVQECSFALIAEALFCAGLDWLTNSPFYLTFPAAALVPLILAACTKPIPPDEPSDAS